jgi:signal transduction histidine kinase
VQRDFLTTVKQQTGQLQNLINDLLEFSRLESGQVKLRIEKVSLAALADRVIGKLAPLASDARLRLISSFSDGFPLVEADETRLEQVLTNLVDNAIKFSQAGGQVVVEGRDLGEQVQVSVRDTGIGIPMEEQERIFDRFYQVDGGSTRQHRGTGLGLTICKHIIENHHGRIWVESELGEGSTFYFVLPKELLQEEQIALDFTTLPSQRRG